MADLFKEIIPSILQTKRNVLISEEDEKTYVPFIVNRALSLHFDCVLYANEMNMNHGLPKNMQYHFLINKVRGYKRPFGKWYKRETLDDIEVIKEYFDYSTEKAKEALRVLNKYQLDEIRKRLNKGGNNDKLGRSGVGKTT
jgi:hypothetical protein